VTTPARPAPSLDAILDAFGLAPSEVQAFDPAHPHVDAQRPLLILAAQLEEAADVIAERYPPAHDVMSLTAGGVTASTTDALDPAEPAEAWLLAAVAPEQDARSLAGLRAIMERLYSPDGCPWDYDQTHESLRSYLIEESYEAIEAIDRGDLDGLREELGDILLQVFFHAVVAQASGAFTLDDVAETIVRKMVRRHPHVFGDAERGSSAEEQWARWDAIKAAERAEAGKRGEDDSPDEIFVAAIGDIMLRVPGLRLADAQTSRAPTYAYLFDWKSPGMDGALGSCHALELPFVFGTHDTAPEFCGSGPVADAFSELTMDTWLAFAKTGNPATTGAEAPTWDPEAKPIQVLGDNPRVEHDWRGPEVGVWDEVVS
jgi:NTP pyrophosphatase (non-canonical NTP hydrolase)